IEAVRVSVHEARRRRLEVEECEVLVANEGSGVLPVRAEWIHEGHDHDQAGELEQARNFAGASCLLRAVRVREAEIRTESKAQILSLEPDDPHPTLAQLPLQIA